MQIILIQTEVEQAIKDYVSKRLTVSEGTDIQIELSATRGAEGIKAIIDLVPATPASTVKRTALTPKSVVVAETAKEPAPVAAAAAAKNPNPVVTVISEPKGKAAPAPAVEAVAETAQDESEGTEAAETAEAEAAGDTGEVVEEVVAAPATPPVRSLFANLRKPVNPS